MSRPPTAGPREPQGDRPDELVEGVGLRDLVGREDVGDDRVECGLEERGARPVNGDEDDHCQTSSTPVSERTASAPTARPRTTSEAIITRRRGKRSLATPPISTNTTIGRLQATPTADMAVGTFDSS